MRHKKTKQEEDEHTATIPGRCSKGEKAIEGSTTTIVANTARIRAGTSLIVKDYSIKSEAISMVNIESLVITHLL